MNHPPSTLNHAAVNPLDRAVHGASTAELSVLQKRELCILARRAFVARQQAGLAPQTEKGQAHAVSERWRYEENFKACHKEHLRACTQADWPLLKAHYLRLLGHVVPARALETRAATNDVRVALFKLRAEFAAARDVIGNPEAYVGHIAITRWQRPLSELTARQLWVLVFDLRRNAASRRKKIARGEMKSLVASPASHVAESHPSDAAEDGT